MCCFPQDKQLKRKMDRQTCSCRRADKQDDEKQCLRETISGSVLYVTQCPPQPPVSFF